MSDYIEMAQGKLGRVIVVRLRPGADVLLSLEEACREHNITNGVILSAIGSLDGVAYCNPVELPEKKAGYGYGEVLRPPRQRARRPSGRGHEGAADAGCRDRGGRRH